MAHDRKPSFSLSQIQLMSMQLQQVPVVHELLSLCFPDPYSPQLLAEELSIAAAHPWVVFFEEKIVGFLDFWKILDEVQLISIAVHPDWRSLKIGKFLLSFLEEWTRKEAVQKIFLEVRESNEVAIQFYQKSGYQRIAVRLQYYANNGENAWVMEKKV